MNIFSVLSDGNSSLREVSMSALLAYFLNPGKGHGLLDVFLREFLEAAGMGESIRNIQLDNSTVALESKLGDGHIDMEIILHHDDQSPAYRILVENKIKRGAVDPDQLQGYYDAAKQGDEHGDLPTTMVFLTPPPFDTYREKARFDGLVIGDGDSKVHLHWVDGQDDSNSIKNIIRNKILVPESTGDISPIGDYVKHTLKAFVTHLQAMHERSSGGKASPVPASDADGGTSYFIDDYEVVKNNKGYVFVRKDGDKVVAKPVLREINEKYELGVDEHGLNTHRLGKMIIRAWQARCAEDK